MFSQVFKKADFEVRIISKRSEIMRMWNSEEEAGRKEYYYERDDHVSIRRASFRPGRNRIGIHRNRNLDKAGHACIEDDGVDMSTPGSGGSCRRFNPYSWRSHNQAGGYGRGKRRSSQGGPAERQRKFSDTSALFYKVTIPHGGKYSKDYILQMLLDSIAPAVFVPLGYEVQGRDSSFFIDDSQAAEKLAIANRKVTTIEGYKLLVKVRPGLPHVEIDSNLKEKLKAAMEKRYNRNLKALDLSRFHTDPDLAGNYAVALVRPNVMLTVLDVIMENVPELAALDLSDNKLYSLDSLSVLSIKVPNLRALHIGRNRIQDMHVLDCLEGLRLEELVLNGNPLCKKYEDKTIYMSEVRKRFPKVLKLDGADLPPPILFDVNEDFQVPATKESFLCAEEGMTVMCRFLQEYYQIFDSNSRDQLVRAYHDDTVFSLTWTYPQGQSSAATSKHANYITDSQNLLHVKDDTGRQNLLYKGKAAVITCICKLPKTQHDPHSFAVDVPLFTPQMILMSVSGIFREPAFTENRPLRSFRRVFVIVPAGEGLCITNDQLYVTNATDEQSKAAFRTARPVLMPPPAPEAVPIPVASSSEAALIDDNMKMQMVESFTAQSGMNVTYARKCLCENNWCMQQATYVFNILKEQGKIPAEAFMK